MSRITFISRMTIKPGREQDFVDACNELTAKVKVNMNQPERLAQIREALSAQNAEVNLIPLHRQVIPWASRGNFSVPHRADNFVTPYWATLK
mgnify:CR=1 FL=1